MTQAEQQIDALNTLISAHTKTIKTIEENKLGLNGRMLGINLNGLSKEIESLKKQKEQIELKSKPKTPSLPSKDSGKTNENLDFLSAIGTEL